MNDLRTAAQQALEALENTTPTGFNRERDKQFYAAIDTLRTALAQQPSPPPEAQTKAEKIAYCAGWWAAMQKKAEQQQAEPLNGLTKEQARGWFAEISKPLAQECACGDRAADKCPGEWEPGCDLGNNPKFALRVPLPLAQQAEPVCRCDFRTRMVGDGCEVCNPELAKELAQQEQAEPVAWREWIDGWQYTEEPGSGQPLYTAPPAAPQPKPVAWRFRTKGVDGQWRLADDPHLVDQMLQIGHWEIRELADIGP